MNYKGYRAAVSFDERDEIMVGRIAGIKDVVGFHADNTGDLGKAFREAVDDYLESCKQLGKQPERAFSGKVMVRMDPRVHANASIAAEICGTSLNEFAESALAEKADRVLA